MKSLKTTIFLFCTTITANVTFANPPNNPFYQGPYICVHLDLPTASNPNPNPKAYAYGEVTNGYEECPVYNEDNPLNIELTEADLENVTWQENGPSWQTNNNTSLQTILSLFLNSLIFNEDPHNRDGKPHDPTCRFGVMF